jgi:hypothetical protein
MVMRAMLRWASLAVFVAALGLMGRARLHLSHFNRFVAILLALSILTTLVFRWSRAEPSPPPP